MPSTSMPTPISRPPHYLYDPQETLAHFRTRQQHAYAAGRRAWRERLLKAQLLPFYEALVSYVGRNQYTWVKEQTLAEQFAVHVATIKRWLGTLIDAGLIRRQRRFATSSLTFITAYDVVEADITNADNHHETYQEKEDYRQTDAGVVEREDAPTFGANVPPESINTDHLTVGGGDATSSTDGQGDATAELLQREGVNDYYLTPAIDRTAFSELQAISGYLDRQRNVRDRPRLFAWLARRGFGAQLLNGRARSAQDCRPPARHQGQRKHRAADAGTAGGSASPTAAWRAEMPPTGDAAELRRTWTQILAHLQPMLPPDVFATWFADTALLALEERAVVGTPQVFARDVLLSEYLPLLQQAVQAVVHRFVEVVVVIDSPPCYATSGRLHQHAPAQ